MVLKPASSAFLLVSAISALGVGSAVLPAHAEQSHSTAMQVGDGAHTQQAHRGCYFEQRWVCTPFGCYTQWYWVCY